MRCFILDDDQQTCEMMRLAVGRMFSEVVVANDAEEFYTEYCFPEPAVLLCDYDLSGPNGADVAGYIQSKKWPIAVIGVTGHTNPEFEFEMRRKGAIEFLSKPIKLGKINDAVSDAIAIATEMGRRSEIDIKIGGMLGLLSKKEKEVLFARLSNLRSTREQLADKLKITLSSIGHHMDTTAKKGVLFDDAEEQYVAYLILKNQALEE